MADTIDLIEFIEVYETQHTEDANEHLKEGWILIATHTRVSGAPGDGQETVYCLGLKPRGKYYGE